VAFLMADFLGAIVADILQEEGGGTEQEREKKKKRLCILWGKEWERSKMGASTMGEAP